jgi:hypothetical protein
LIAKHYPTDETKNDDIRGTWQYGEEERCTQGFGEGFLRRRVHTEQ